jgi:hypothetical protein
MSSFRSATIAFAGTVGCAANTWIRSPFRRLQHEKDRPSQLLGDFLNELATSSSKAVPEALSIAPL